MPERQLSPSQPAAAIPAPAIVVIFGITGDLAQRYLLPALYHLLKDGLLAPETEIIGITRQDLTAAQLLDTVDVCVHEPSKTCDPAVLADLRRRLRLIRMDSTDERAYANLLQTLNTIEEQKGVCLNRLYYLSVPPQLQRPIIKHMGTQGLNGSCQHGRATTSLLVEKPFGYDLISARELIDETAAVFNEKQIFRIDHFLAKQSVQDILQFRVEYSAFDRIWNASAIQQVEIIASEKIGIEGRAQFYDSLGALRDFIQNHLLQLLSIIAMEQPTSLSSNELHLAKQHALEAVIPVPATEVTQRTLRGQYDGYRAEVNNTRSSTETYADITVFINNQRWQGVPFRLWTGKALAEKKYEIRLLLDSKIWGDDSYLCFRIQPDATIAMRVNAQPPQLDADLQAAINHFAKPQPAATEYHQAYERVLLDAMRGDRTLFVTSGEVLASWRIIQPVLDAWASNNQGLVLYSPQTAGPLTPTESAVT